MFTIPLGDGRTVARVDGSLDPSLPLVVLLHGFGGDIRDMTNPIDKYRDFAFNRNAVYPLVTVRGGALLPPLVPVHSFFLDPPETSLTSWMQSLTAAGFSTIAYEQSGPTPAPDVVQLVAQLAALATGPLSNDSRLSGLRIAFVAHSRGGIVARSFLTSARTDPALAGFLSRVSSLVTLHSPNLGIGLANIVVGIDALLAAFAGMSVSVPDWLTRLRGLTHDPAYAEVAVGSTVLAEIAAREPVPGISYHTFGGTSTAFARLWANVFSVLPNPLLIPPLILNTSPMLIGVPLDAASFIPVAVLTGLPEVVTTVAAVNALASTSPELRNGTGDLIVTDAHARLPFSTSHTTSALNHAEVLWNPTVQAQVVAILLNLRATTIEAQPSKQVAYRTADGHIHELSVALGGSWSHADLSSLTGAPSAPATPGGFMSAFAFEAQRSKQVAYRTVDGHIHELSVVVGGNWSHADLSAMTGAPAAAPGGFMSVFAVEAMRSKQAVYLTADGHIHELSVAVGGNWSHADLSVMTDAPAAAPGSFISGFAVEAMRSKQAVYLTADGHVHELSVAVGGNWSHADLSVMTDAPAAAPGSFISGFAVEAMRSKQVVYLTADGRIHELSVAVGGNWSHADLSVITDAPAAAPGGFISGFAVEAMRSKQAVYLTADGHVHELSVAVGGSWSHADLSVMTDAPAAAPGSFISGFAVEAMRSKQAVYVTADGHIHELSVAVGGNWSHADLSVMTGAPSAV